MDDEFILDAELIEVVLAEAQENLESAIAALKQDAPGTPLVDALFRCFHSIKGNCAMAHRLDVSSAAHALETCLDKVREKRRSLLREEVQKLLAVCDLMMSMILEESPTLASQLQNDIALWNACLDQMDSAPGIPASEPGRDDHREDANRQDRGESANLKVSAHTVMAAMAVAGELFQLDERLKHFVTRTLATRSARGGERLDVDQLHQLAREFDGRIEKLYELLLDIQRLPVAQIATPLERALRDICRKTGKEIHLDVVGLDLRVDKQVLQILRDPLMHMIRNSADHGIEFPQEREKSGKNPEGKIILTVEDLDDSVAVTIEDDGAGIDLERVKAKAVDRGLVDEKRLSLLSEKDIIEFIFAPGFSTASVVSDLSGRGVGMDVVLQQIRGAGGAVHSSTVRGRGSKFRLEVPKAGSPVVDGLAVRAGPTVHLLPLKNVVTFVGRHDMRMIRTPSGQVMAMLGERIYPLFRPPGEIRRQALTEARTIGVLVEGNQRDRGLVLVDDVLGRRKALVQRVRKDALEEECFEVCILGDGTMAFSLDVDSVLSDSEMLWTISDEKELGEEFFERAKTRQAS